LEKTESDIYKQRKFVPVLQIVIQENILTT